MIKKLSDYLNPSAKCSDKYLRKNTWLPNTINREKFRHASFTQSIRFQELEKYKKKKKLDSQTSYEIFKKK